MCLIEECDDRYLVYRTKDEVRAAKPHRCCECGRPIAVGEIYHKAVGLYANHWDTHHTCTHCRVACLWLKSNCGGFLHEGVLEDIEMHADEYPSLRSTLNRLIVGMRRDWRRFDKKGLMAVPRLPPSIGEVLS